jgi:hypothetical protein
LELSILNGLAEKKQADNKKAAVACRLDEVLSTWDYN